MSRPLRIAFIAAFLLGGCLSLALAAYGLSLLGDTPTWGWILTGIGAGGAAIAVLGLLLPDSGRVNLTLVLISSGIAVLIGNWLLLQQNPYADIDQRRIEAAEAGGLDFDRRTPLEVVDALRREGIDAQPIHSPGAVLLDYLDGDRVVAQAPFFPLTGISRSRTVVCNESGDYLMFDTDRHGFNNPDIVYEIAPPLVIIGDSFAFGYCVHQGESVASQLRARGYSLLNLGYPGTGPLIQLAQLREFGPLTRPELVVWLYYAGNDVTNLLDEYRHPVLRRYLDPEFSQGLAERQAEVDAWLRELVARREGRGSHSTEPSVLRSLLTLAPLRQRLGLTRRDFDDYPIRVVGRVAEAIRDEVARQGGRLVFVYLPTYADMIGLRPRKRDRVLDAIEAAGIRIVNFEQSLLAEPDPLAYYPFRLHGHFTGEGYRLLAEQLMQEVLSEQELISDRRPPPAALRPAGIGGGLATLPTRDHH